MLDLVPLAGSRRVIGERRDGENKARTTNRWNITQLLARLASNTI
jgi:hypothetical protein